MKGDFLPAVVSILLLLTGCTRESDRIDDPTDGRSVTSVLERAEQALSGPLTVDDVNVIRAAADVRGPNYPFRTVVISARDGRMVFDQESPQGRYVMGINDDMAWIRDPSSDSVRTGDVQTKMFLRGHELHMIALDPGSRFSNPRRLPDTTFAGIAVTGTAFQDELDADIILYHSSDTGRPVGMILVNHTGSGAPKIEVELSQWQESGGLNLFTRAVFRQGESEYVYDYKELELNAPFDSGY